MPQSEGNRTIPDVDIQPSEADLHHVPFVDYRDMALPPGVRQRPQWITEEGLCFIGCWEILPWRRHSGIATTHVAQDYAFEQSPAFLDDIIALGCNAVVVPYDCGHGEECNEPEVQRTKAFIQLAHARGVKVGVYFRPDIVWLETLSEEELAELDGAFQLDRQGRMIQPFGATAANVCYHHPGARARFKRHVQRAITELQADMLHLDGMIIGNAEGRGACRCPRCTEDFRQFLLGRYDHDRGVATQRFGHPYLERMIPPGNYPIDWAPFDSGPVEPNWAEWMAFRCTWTSRILAEVAEWAHELDPEVAIEINNALPAVRENAALDLGTDVIGVGHYTDASWSEDGYGPLLHENGLLTTRIRQFKLCRAANTFALTYMHEQDERPLRQNLAHTAAFNEGNIGCIGFPPHMNFSNRYSVHFAVKCDFMRWLNDHRPFFRGTRSAAQIALWRPRENMAMSGKMAYAAAMRLEQLLIETCQGFDIVFDESPAALGRYALVIVPNIECLSLEQIEGLHQYVHAGGSLLVGQDSAMFDLWHRRRIENPWAALFGDASAKNVVADAVAQGAAGIFVAAGTRNASTAISKVAYGTGRAAYAPLIVDPASQPSMLTVHGALDCGLDYTNWVVPEQAEALRETLTWLMNGQERFSVSAERGMLSEFLSQPEARRHLVHLINLRPTPQTGVVVEMRGAVGEISVLHPPTDVPPRWQVEATKDGQRVRFDVLDTYAIVVVPDVK
jgi:hypothetical protein